MSSPTSLAVEVVETRYTYAPGGTDLEAVPCNERKHPEQQKGEKPVLHAASSELGVQGVYTHLSMDLTYSVLGPSYGAESLVTHRNKDRNVDQTLALLVPDDPRLQAGRLLDHIAAQCKAKGAAAVTATRTSWRASPRGPALPSHGAGVALEGRGEEPSGRPGRDGGQLPVAAAHGRSRAHWPALHRGDTGVEKKNPAVIALAAALKAARVRPAPHHASRRTSPAARASGSGSWLRWSITSEHCPVARLIGVTRRTVYLRLKRYSIDRRRVPRPQGLPAFPGGVMPTVLQLAGAISVRSAGRRHPRGDPPRPPPPCWSFLVYLWPCSFSARSRWRRRCSTTFRPSRGSGAGASGTRADGVRGREAGPGRRARHPGRGRLPRHLAARPCAPGAALLTTTAG